MTSRDYGSKARIGVAMPQANPTVEPEMSACFPAGVSMLATRLVSSASEPKTRMLEFYERLDHTLASYDILKLDALAFACTASSYLVGSHREDKEMAALSAKRGYPIITGGQAIIAALRHLRIKRIAIGAPYPDYVITPCKAYYQAAGFAVTALQQIKTHTADTRTIYELSSADALDAAEALDLSSADAVLFTGSGMPTLRAIPEVGKRTGLPVLCTNLCLAWAVLRAAKVATPPGPHPLLNGWQDRLAAL